VQESLYSDISTTTATWDAKSQIPDTYTTNAKIRVTVNDNETANNTSSSDSATFILDTKNPVVGTPTGGGTGINVNQNATTSLANDKTNSQSVTLYLSASDDSTIEMMISENSDFSGASWEAYASSKSLTLSSGDGTKTVYVKFKDQYGNLTSSYSDTIILDTTPPTAPANVIIQDISNPDISEYRMFVNWKKNSESDWINYKVYRSTDGSNYSLLQTITDINTNYITDSGLTQGTTYYYKIVSTDDILNAATSSVVSLEAGSNPSDNVAPTISNVATSTITASSAKVTWVTNEVADTTVFYSVDTSYNLSQGVSGYATSHDVTLVGLDSGTTYRFYVRSIDPSANSATSTSGTFTTSGADATAPNISSITVSTTTPKSATITWTTDEAGTSLVEYSQTDGFSSGDIYGQYDSTTTHSVILPSVLTPATTYYFKVRSKDAAGNEAVSTQQSFTTQADPADTQKPTISSIATSSVAYNTATVTWTTNENSSSYVEFGKTTDYGRIYGQDDSVTSHSVSLPKDLDAATQYHFRVRSVDTSGNEAISGDYTFTTAADPADSTAPTISSVSIGEATSTSITISWSTNEDADSYIEYSSSTNLYNLSQGKPTMTTSHSVTLVGLSPSTEYYFRVKSADPSGNTAYDDNSGAGYTFVTASGPTPPVISSIQIVDVSTSSVTIIWTTDKSSDSFVEYGLDTSYGTIIGQYESVTSHSVTLTGLLSSATYHFRVRSRGSSEAVSQDYTFTTGGNPAAEDLTGPTISSVQAESISYNSVAITWKTDETASSQVVYGTSQTYGATTTLDTTLTRNHAVVISNLSQNTKYYYKVISKDQAGNQTEDDNSGQSYNFTTLTPQTETKIVSAGGGGTAPAPDTTPPGILSLKAVELTENSAKITWSTNEGATGLVKYGQTTVYGLEVSESTGYFYSHEIKLDNLTPGTLYHFKAISRDLAGNSGESSDQTFTTLGEAPAEEEVSEIAPPKMEKPAEEKEITEEILKELPPALEKKVQEAISKTEEAGITQVIIRASKTFVASVIEALPHNPFLAELDETKFIASVSEIAPKVVSAPQISGVMAEVGADYAKILWITDKKSNSLVAYASGAEYHTEKEEPYIGVFGNKDEATTTHQVLLPGLTPNTLYHYQVRSTAQIGPEGRSIDSTFTTLSLLPEISGVVFKEITEKTATIAWETTLPTKTRIEITDVKTGEVLTQEDPSFLKAHRFTVEGLKVSTSYSLQIFAENEEGNTSFSSILPFSTVISLEPPVISQVRISTSLIPGRIERVQAIISWKTDKPATSKVLYEEGITAKKELALSTPLDPNLVVDHIVITTAFKPGRVYRFRVESIDAFNNKSYSKDYTILTPRPRETVLDLIIENFEQTFEFLKRIKF
jgi:hypothetical protein